MTEKTELTCRESRWILKVSYQLGVDKIITSSVLDVYAACEHYIHCDFCKKLGLSKICDVNLTCKEALEICATKPGPLYLGYSSTLKEQIAVEHVWGRSVKMSPACIGVCPESSCSKLRHYWLAVPLSCFYDGEKETGEEIPFLIGIFLEKGWSLEKLLEIQQQRIKTLLKDLGANKTPSHRINDVKDEILANIKALQMILLETTKQTKKGSD